MYVCMWCSGATGGQQRDCCSRIFNRMQRSICVCATCTSLFESAHHAHSSLQFYKLCRTATLSRFDLVLLLHCRAHIYILILLLTCVPPVLQAWPKGPITCKWRRRRWLLHDLMLRAKSRMEEATDSAMAYGIAVGSASSKAGAPDEEVEKVMQSIAPIGIERIGKFVADYNKPRPIWLVFNIPQQKHTILSYAKDLRQAGIRVDDDVTRAQRC